MAFAFRPGKHFCIAAAVKLCFVLGSINRSSSPGVRSISRDLRREGFAASFGKGNLGREARLE